MRARLYLAASRLFSDAYDAAVVDLRTLSASKLDRADAILLAVARRAGMELRLAPDAAVVNAQGEPGADEGAAAGAVMANLPAAIRQGSPYVAARLPPH